MRTTGPGSSFLLEPQQPAGDPLIHASRSVFLSVVLSCSRLHERSGLSSVSIWTTVIVLVA